MACKTFYLSLLLFIVNLPTSVYAAPEEHSSTLTDQEMVAVTIYNDDLALIKDKRHLTFKKGINKLAFREVSGQLRPETAIMRSISHSRALTVMEQNFDFDLLTPQKMIEKYVGKKVGVVKTHPTTGEETVEEAVVLSANNGVVLRIGDRIETGIPGRLIFSEVPDNLRDRPTLTMNLYSETDQEQTVELSYLSGGLSWKADYVAELNADDSRVDINGWVTLANTSGATYNNAVLQLVAGDVHQAAPPIRRRPMEVLDMARAEGAPQMAEEALFEYHLYTLDRPTTILENQTKQVALLQAAEVACAKEYLLAGREYYYQNRYGELGDKIKVGVMLAFANAKKDNLGLPLPKGIVRVYKKDSEGRVQFIGEDRIDHTPENETVRLKLGNAFDVTAERKQTDFKKLSGFSRYNYAFESAYEIKLKNAKDEEVTVKVVEPLPGDWEITNENLPHKKETAATAAWQVKVPAKNSAVLKYRATVRF